MVRQLFEMGIIQSGFWHQFALTAHSPIGLKPIEYGITPTYQDISFANNDIDFVDSTGIDHSKFSFGLRKSLFNYMHGIGFELPLKEWFKFKIPKTQVKSDFISDCLVIEPDFKIKPSAKVVWLGTVPITTEITKTKRGVSWELLQCTFHDKTETFTISLDKNEGTWLLKMIPKLSPHHDQALTFSALKTDFEAQLEDFELFWFSKPMQQLKGKGLLVL
jgi:hypothetical protein